MRGLVANMIASSVPPVSALLLPGSPTVYLAGPIAGLNYAGATDWRATAIAELAAAGIVGLSPMRGFEHLAGVECFEATAADTERNVLSSPRGLTTRDRFDATRCDVLLVNLAGASKVSVGTVMEIAWADLKRIPIVAVMEPGNVHEHAMIDQVVGYRVATLEEALAVVKAILA